MRLVLLLVLFSFGCEQKVNRTELISIQGFNRLTSREISCKKPLVISAVEFSNGLSYKLIQGTIRLNKKVHPFTILVDSTKVIEQKFPITEIDSTNYSCKIKYPSKNSIEIEWTKKGRRLFLRKKLSK